MKQLFFLFMTCNMALLVLSKVIIVDSLLICFMFALIFLSLSPAFYTCLNPIQEPDFFKIKSLHILINCSHILISHHQRQQRRV